MAYALDLAFDLPPRWGYLICALVVLPLVTHGFAAISRLQVWTQALWLLLLLGPFLWVLGHQHGLFAGVVHHAGARTHSAGWDPLGFGAALTVGVALITQMGEQADYLRFMPAADRSGGRGWRWWGALLLGGPGWVLLGMAKMLAGALLAWLAVSRMVPPDRAVDPNQMYLGLWETFSPSYGWAVAATALFVVLSQVKINVTNAYAGSLAWSNFFSRLTHSHPGRVVWVVFNTGIAFLLMEMNLFEALGAVLGLYANVAIAWMMAVVADLVINKPLGLSPPGIEFKRAYLWDINPVGVGAMGLASLLSVAAHLGLFGPLAQAWSAVIAMLTALVSAPLIAWWTGGRFQLARTPVAAEGDYARLRPGVCVICAQRYEAPDLAQCPAYQGQICSLCCTLDARCGDLCKPQARLSAQWHAFWQALLPRAAWPWLQHGAAQALLAMSLLLPLAIGLLLMVYQHEWAAWGATADADRAGTLEALLRSTLSKAGLLLVLVLGIAVWWGVLALQSRTVAREESQRQTEALMQEIASHQRTDAALQQARQEAEEARAAAEAANQAKSRYVSSLSHELRTPLNSLLGYAQLMGEDAELPPRRRQAVQVIRRSGEHLLTLIDASLDLARIEAGRLVLAREPFRLDLLLDEVADMVRLQAASRGLAFHDRPPVLPEWVRGDARRLRQVLLNLLGNAVKFTVQGEVRLQVQHSRDLATLCVLDSGPGLPADALEHVFEPFDRGAGSEAPGAGLGLTISRMLAQLMGGDLRASNRPEGGAAFTLRLHLPALSPQAGAALDGATDPSAWTQPPAVSGAGQLVLLVDNEAADRQLLRDLLEPMGFDVREAANGHDALDLLATGLRPAVLLVDLAMPGIDGWETLRRAQALWGEAPLPPHAIVSANAFEKDQPRPPGVPAGAFFTKPVRHPELLAWLGGQLQARPLTGDGQGPADDAPAAAAPDAIRHAEALASLQQALDLGYVRGVQEALAALRQASCWPADALVRLQSLASGLQLTALRAQLQTLQEAPMPQDLTPTGHAAT